MSLTNDEMQAIREKAQARAERDWFGPDQERIRATWHNLASYAAFCSSCDLRDAAAAKSNWKPGKSFKRDESPTTGKASK